MESNPYSSNSLRMHREVKSTLYGQELNAESLLWRDELSQRVSCNEVTSIGISAKSMHYISEEVFKIHHM